MNLEQVETLCLNYLRQSKTPLVPVGKLLEHCRRDPACGALDLPDFLAFLRKHGEIQVMEGPAPGEEVDAALFSEAGLDMGPRAILNVRMPSREEFTAMMAQQIEVMHHSLDTALAEARRKRDTARAAKLEAAVERAKALREKMRQVLGAGE